MKLITVKAEQLSCKYSSDKAPKQLYSRSIDPCLDVTFYCLHISQEVYIFKNSYKNLRMFQISSDLILFI